MPLRPQVRFALAAGAVVIVAGTAALAWSEVSKAKKAKPVGPGSFLCPRHAGHRPAPTASLKPGDFVIVQLQAGDGSFHESTWATILAVVEDQVVAVLTGEQLPTGVRPLQTAKHGFRLGHRMILDRDCIWEVFQPVDHGGQILCGPQILELAKFLGDDDLFPVKAGLTVQPGDRAQILVGSKESFGNLWNERLWTRIVSISPSGQVITAILDDEPELTDNHNLVRGSVVRYNRDCVIGT